MTRTMSEVMYRSFFLKTKMQHRKSKCKYQTLRDNNNIFIRIADDNVLVVTMIYFSWFSEHIIEQWIGKFIMFDMYVI